MNAPKVASILLVAIISLTILNFLLKYYTYFVLVVAAHQSQEDTAAADDGSGPVPHPHELYVPFLTFIPAISPVIFRPWVLLTAGLIEDSFLLLGPTVLAVFYLGGFLESKWGVEECLRFVLVVLVGSNFALYLYYSVCAFVLGAARVDPPVIILSTAVVMALLVAVKQRILGHYVILFKGGLRIKVTYLPFLALLGLFLLLLLSDNYRVTWLLSLVGFAVSWTYLRYFKGSSNERQSYLLPFTLRRPGPSPAPLAPGPALAFNNTLTRGDRSDQFALATFFPRPLASVVQMVSNYTFRFMIKRQWVDAKDYTSFDEEVSYDEVNTLLLKLFSLSTLKGAGEVAPIPHAESTIRIVLEWFKGSKRNVDIKDSMDKRRKLAIRELD